MKTNLFLFLSLFWLSLTVTAIQQWNSYLDNLVADSNSSIDKAAIAGLDGSQWTDDSHQNSLKLSDSERNTIAQAMKMRI